MKKQHTKVCLEILIILFFVFTVQVFIATEVSAQEKTFQFTFAGVLPKGSLTARSMDIFAERVNSESNGRIQIKTIHGTTLGGEKELIESIRIGSLDGGCFGSVLGSFYPKIDIWNVPYLFRDDYWLNEILKGHIGKELLDGLESINLKGLGYLRYGARGIGNNKRPINKPEDIKGLKIRTIENDMCVMALEALGAVPVTMSVGDAIMGMRQKLVDGIDFPQACLNAFKIDEMIKYFANTQHTWSPVPIVISMEKFKSLPTNLQKLLLKIGSEVGDYHCRVFLKQEETKDRYKTYEKLGDGVLFSDPDKELFRMKCVPLYKKLRKQRPDLVGMMEEIMKVQGIKLDW
ncbi:MAG: TRAP transporter substrate-binding protein [Deltaproteobacteria bacterium]|nr:TRAP transporter substrate-binding protein [Deltaproteobacteria bacterium]